MADGRASQIIHKPFATEAGLHSQKSRRVSENGNPAAVAPMFANRDEAWPPEWSGKLAECSGVPFGRAGVLGQASLSAYGSVRWLKVWLGGGCNFGATERAHKRNGDQIDAEWRRPGLVVNFDPILTLF